MSNATKFFKNLIESALLGVNTCMPCKVLSYDETTRRAKIQPLFMTKTINGEPEPLPVLDNVPVLFQRFKYTDRDNGNHTVTQEMIPVLEKDDVVLVVFAQRALDKVLNGQMAYPEINRRHSLNDGVIVGVLS